MPIAIDNGFPNLAVDLGDSTDLFSLSGLFDTCGSLNTGYLPFHAWIASQHPHAVVEFRYYNGSTPFEPVRLEGAVTDPPCGVTDSTHGLLTAIVRYKTPYIDRTGSPISISFALGNDVSTNTIFGLPTITAFAFLVVMSELTAVSRNLNKTFTLSKSAGKLGLPDDVCFDPESHRRIHEAALAVAPQHGLGPPRMIPSASPTTTLFGQDDCSQGYLRRTLITPHHHT